MKDPRGMLRVLFLLSELYGELLFGEALLKALWKALPAAMRGKSDLPLDMARDLYRNWDNVNMAKAIEGVLKAIAWERLGGNLEIVRNAIAKNLRLWKTSIRTYGPPQL